MVEKVTATPAALELVAFLQEKHGPALMFHQSGGCCDNSAANCYLPGEITMGAGDVTGLGQELVRRLGRPSGDARPDGTEPPPT